MLNNLCEAYYTCVNQAETSFINCQADQYFNPSTNACGVTYPPGGVCQSKSRLSTINGKTRKLEYYINIRQTLRKHTKHYPSNKITPGKVLGSAH